MEIGDGPAAVTGDKGRARSLARCREDKAEGRSGSQKTCLNKTNGNGREDNGAFRRIILRIHRAIPDRTMFDPVFLSPGDGGAGTKGRNHVFA